MIKVALLSFVLGVVFGRDVQHFAKKEYLQMSQQIETFIPMGMYDKIQAALS